MTTASGRVKALTRTIKPGHHFVRRGDSATELAGHELSVPICR